LRFGILPLATGKIKMTKSDNLHLPWHSSIVVELSTQNPKIDVLNPAPGTGKRKMMKQQKFTFAIAPIAKWS
jgi:hypothetical protein